jgi:hypothetical protein
VPELEPEPEVDPELGPDPVPEPDAEPEPEAEPEPSLPTRRTSDPSSDPHAAAVSPSGTAQSSRRTVRRRAMDGASGGRLGVEAE